MRKITQPLHTQQSRNLSKKIMQALHKKKHATSPQKNHATSPQKNHTTFRNIARHKILQSIIKKSRNLSTKKIMQVLHEKIMQAPHKKSTQPLHKKIMQPLHKKTTLPSEILQELQNAALKHHIGCQMSQISLSKSTKIVIKK